MLAITSLRASYGKIEALKGVDLAIQHGEIVALIGANGAGKSTLMMTIFGKPRARAGSVVYDGTDITGLPTHEIARMRIAQSPEGRRIFPRMSVAENLQMGADVNEMTPAQYSESLDKVLTLFPRLKERMTQRGGTLSGGEQQMLAIGRALMARPKMILMDEPSMGLSPLLVKEVFAIIKKINRDLGVTILLVEQNARAALSVASHGYIMEQGKVVLDGTADELRDNEDVKEFYLGGAGDQRKSFKNLKSFKRRKRWL
jgi:branched-chain amino acid transport system ATP-binding protein